MHQFSINDEAVHILLSGVVDHNDVGPIIQVCYDHANVPFVVDFAGVKEMTSVGVGLLLFIREKSKSFRISNLSAQVRESFGTGKAVGIMLSGKSS